VGEGVGSGSPDVLSFDDFAAAFGEGLDDGFGDGDGVGDNVSECECDRADDGVGEGIGTSGDMGEETFREVAGADDAELGSVPIGRTSLGSKHSFKPAGVSGPLPHTKPASQGATSFPIISFGMHNSPFVLWHPRCPSFATRTFDVRQQECSPSFTRQCSSDVHSKSPHARRVGAAVGEGLGTSADRGEATLGEVAGAVDTGLG